MSLLEKALSSGIGKHDRKASVEQVELALAWLSGTVSIGQVCAAVGSTSKASTQSRLALWLREAYELGHLQINAE